MDKVLAIAQNTFKEAIRNRVMYVILVFAILFILTGIVVKDLTIAAHGTVIRAIGLMAINWFGLILALLLGIGLVYTELDKKTIYTIVSKPIDRWQFLLGKYLGLLLTLYLIIVVMSAVFLIEIHLLNRQIQDPHFGQAVMMCLKAIFLGCVELAVVVAFALLFSSFSSPVLSGFMTLMVIIAGRLNEDIERFAQKIISGFEAGGEVATQGFLAGMAFLRDPATGATLFDQMKFLFAKGTALVFPNFELFNARTQALHFDTVDVNILKMITVNTADALIYAVPYTASVLLLAMFLFGRRNFR
jgi:hypothetical protein